MNDLVKDEFDYRMTEALGILCGPLKPTKSEENEAIKAAQVWADWIKENLPPS